MLAFLLAAARQAKRGTSLFALFVSSTQSSYNCLQPHAHIYRHATVAHSTSPGKPVSATSIPSKAAGMALKPQLAAVPTARSMPQSEAARASACVSKGRDWL